MQTPSLEQWAVLEDEFSNSVLETTEALLNASLRLPLDSKIKVYVVSHQLGRIWFLFCTKYLNFASLIQVETKELAEALVVASKSMEGIVQNIGNLVPKVSKIQSICFTLNMNRNKVIYFSYTSKC